MFIKDEDIASYQLLLIKQDRVLVIEVLASLTSESGIFFFPFSKKMVGRAMGNETFYWDGLKKNQFSLQLHGKCSRNYSPKRPLCILWHENMKKKTKNLKTKHDLRFLQHSVTYFNIA